MKKTLTLIFILLCCNRLFAVIAYPHPIDFQQPNGKQITIQLFGDEKMHWCETSDGFTLLHNSDGFLCYAELNENDQLVPSKLIATNIDERAESTRTFLQTIQKSLRFSIEQKMLFAQIWETKQLIYDENVLQFNSKSTFKSLMALVQFPEKLMIKTPAEFEVILNHIGKNSVRDFFLENSYNKLNVEITICGPYTTPESNAYYAGSSGSARCGLLAYWAGTQAKADVNLQDFDNDNNGEVDSYHFIFAGRGKEATGQDGTIWSHASSMPIAVAQNGIVIWRYSCSPELYGYSITTIGVICHEMTHVFGSPDFYDTGYEGFPGTGSWDLMASGSWNGNGGSSPAHVNGFQKYRQGWVTPIVLGANPTYISNMPNSTENPVLYRINTQNGNEHFILENRQKIGFDQAVPGAGLIIYHAYSTVPGYNVNIGHPQKMYVMCASSTLQEPNYNPASYGNVNSAGAPFPGTSNQTGFTDDTAPWMRTWTRERTEKPITFIQNVNKLVSFAYKGGNPVNEHNPIENVKITASGKTISLFNPSNVVIKNITIFDIYGREVYSNNNIQENFSISLELPTAIYLVKLTAENNSQKTQKIMINY